MKREFQIGFLKSVGLLPEHMLFDIGCGTLRGGVPLIEYLEPGHYYGLESRPEVLAQGLLELNEAGLATRKPCLILNSDVGALKLSTSFDFIWAFSVLIHMNDDVADACLRFVGRHLTHRGCFYANVNIGRTQVDGAWQGFPVTQRSAGFYKELGAAHGLQMQDIGSLESLGHKSGQRGDHQHVLRYSRS